MSSTENTPEPTLEQNRAIAREFFAGVQDRDVDRMQAVWEMDTIDAFPGFRTMRVPEEQRVFFEQFFDAFHDWIPEVLDITCEGNVAVVHWRLSIGFSGPGKFDGFAATGRQGTVQGCDRLIIEDGKIIHLDAYFDTMEMAREIGLMPPAGSAADKGMTKVVNLQTRIKSLLNRG